MSWIRSGGAPLRGFGGAVRPLGVLILVAALATAGDARPGGPGGAAFRGRTVALSATQVVAHDGRFWVGGDPLVLHGDRVHMTDTDIAQKAARDAGWGMNVIRIMVGWSSFEPLAPVHNADGTWTHTYSASATSSLLRAVSTVSQAGLYSIVTNAGLQSSYFGYPDWLFTTAYNSHQTTYPKTPDGLALSQADFWSDPLRQRFADDFLGHLASQLAGAPGLVGYETMNEPQTGSLPASATTTQSVLAWQLQAAKVVRASDPSRVIIFMTRLGYDPGLPEVDLHDWVTAPPADPNGLPQPLGFPDVALDGHDYFGGRWGSGLERNPGAPGYLETYQDLYAHVLGQDGESSPPYLGTTVGQVRWLQDKTGVLGPLGIALIVLEIGVPSTNPNAALYFGTTTSALNDLWVSWVIDGAQSSNGIVRSDGTLRSYASIVIDAAGRYPPR